MVSESLKRAQKKYRSRYKQVGFFVDKEADTDIIEWLSNQENYTARLKELIRIDICNNSVIDR